MDKSAVAGCGVTCPLIASEPFSSMRVSSVTLTGLLKSWLTPFTCRAKGANTAFTPGCMVRSSADMLASRTSNCRTSNCHGALAPAGAGVVVAGGAAAGDGADGGAAGADLAGDGACVSFIRL